jgi:hypothetical protein
VLLFLGAGLEEHAAGIGLVVAAGKLFGVLIAIGGSGSVGAVENLAVFRKGFFLEGRDSFGRVDGIHFDHCQSETGSATPKPEARGLGVTRFVFGRSGAGVQGQADVTRGGFAADDDARAFFFRFLLGKSGNCQE